MHDIEALMDNIKSILQADLNGVIDAINLEKPDDAQMRNIDSEAYCFQSLDDEVFNYDPFILYGVIDIENTNNGPYNAESVTLSVTVITHDDTDGNNMTRRMFRYQRALKETLEKNWDKGVIRNKINITSLLPQRITGLNESNTSRVVGIEVETSLP